MTITEATLTLAFLFRFVKFDYCFLLKSSNVSYNSCDIRDRANQFQVNEKEAVIDETSVALRY